MIELLNEQHRTAEGEIRVLSRENEFLFNVELWLLNDAENRNGWRYENIEENMKGFLGTPILTAYINNGKTVGDGHNFKVEKDRDGNPAPSFTGATAERIVGVMGWKPDAVRAEKAEDGKTWIVGRGYIFAWYAKELVNKLADYAEQGRTIPVSIETLVTQSRMEGKVEVEEVYTILGTTILGDHVEPAVEGAKITALSVDESALRELQLRVASYLGEKTETKEENPQERNVRKLEVYTLKQCEKLQEKFGDYHVLKAVKGNDGILHVALCSKDYQFCRYDMGDENEPVVTANIVTCSAMADMGIGENVDISALFDEPAREIARLNAELTEARQTITQRDNQITAMHDAENKRRVKAAKETATRTLAAFNANREEKIAESDISDLCERIESGCYTDMVNEAGEWCGNRAVEDQVYAICARKVQEADAAAATKRKGVYAFEQHDNSDNSGESGIMALLRKDGVLD